MPCWRQVGFRSLRISAASHVRSIRVGSSLSSINGLVPCLSRICTGGLQVRTPFEMFVYAAVLPLIEDAAQAFGAIESGRHLGTIGDAGIYSFGFFKNRPTWRGGMVV